MASHGNEMLNKFAFSVQAVNIIDVLFTPIAYTY